MAKEPEFKRGEKGFLKRFVNLFQNDAKLALDDFKTNTKNSISEVNEVKSELSNEIISLRNSISSLEVKEKNLQIELDQISNFSSSIFEEDDEGIIISDEIEGFVEEFKDYKKEITELKQEIDKYKEELFGTEDEEGNEILGLDHKIESLKKQLQTTIKDGQEKLDSFFDKNSTKKKGIKLKIQIIPV